LVGQVRQFVELVTQLAQLLLQDKQLPLLKYF
jgi:hypothetical protein